jgi:hypothetical protein
MHGIQAFPTAVSSFMCRLMFTRTVRAASASLLRQIYCAAVVHSVEARVRADVLWECRVLQSERVQVYEPRQ